MGTFLVGCSNQQKIGEVVHEERKSTSDQVVTKEAVIVQDQGEKLTEAAGPSAMHISAVEQDIPVSGDMMKFVGRYHTEISCEDAFAHCEKGTAEYIINLLPDGTAHRTFVYKGKLGSDQKIHISKRNYQKNTWSYDERYNQIIVKRIEGIQFFYNVDDNQLVINREKTLNDDHTNKRYFEQQKQYLPDQDYVLTRF